MTKWKRHCSSLSSTHMVLCRKVVCNQAVVQMKCVTLQFLYFRIRCFRFTTHWICLSDYGLFQCVQFENDLSLFICVELQIVPE